MIVNRNPGDTMKNAMFPDVDHSHKGHGYAPKWSRNRQSDWTLVLVHYDKDALNEPVAGD